MPGTLRDVPRPLLVLIAALLVACGGQTTHDPAGEGGGDATARDGSGQDGASPEASADMDAGTALEDASVSDVAEAESVACGIDAACGQCCAPYTCYGGRCCQAGGPADSAAQCCAPLYQLVNRQCILTGQ
jgi:hypothetical protein